MMSSSIFCNACRLNPYSGSERCASPGLRSSPTHTSSSLTLAEPSHRSSSPHTPNLHPVSICNQYPPPTPKQLLYKFVVPAGLSLIASCDGLLCFQGMPFRTPRYDSPGYYYVYNPLTDEWITLPESEFIHGFLCAFYYHPSVKEYRLLRNSRNGYEILTIGAKEWRGITCLFDATPSSFLEFYVLHGPPSSNKPPIPVHGRLHYLPTIGTPLIRIIMVFDINREKFGVMSLPESCRIKEWTIHEARLIELEGKLGVYRCIGCNAGYMDTGGLRETGLGQEVQGSDNVGERTHNMD